MSKLAKQLGKFQFLIGRLKTPTDKAAKLMKELFQFLIGRLKTLKQADMAKLLGSFNSL